MKYFFFDIDGTLTNIHTGEYIPSALEAIKKLQENHFVAICTGRAYYKSKKVMEDTGISHMVSNGGACLTINNKVIKNRPLDKDKAIKLIKEAESKGYGVLISPNDSIDVIMKDTLFIDQVGKRQEPTNYILKEDLNYNDIDIYKIYIAISKKDEDQLLLKDSLGHIRFVEDYLTYQHDEKDKGIKEMIDIVNGNINDVVVFGDGENDIVMFKEEYLKIAMGNGYDKLLEKADYITQSAEDDGIKKALEHFKFI